MEFQKKDRLPLVFYGILNIERSAMDKAALLKEKREEILQLAKKYGAQNVRIFGSIAREEAGPKSDVDFLIQLEAGRSLLDHIGFWQDLQELLGCEVDVVTEKSLHWYIRDKVLKEAVSL